MEKMTFACTFAAWVDSEVPDDVFKKYSVKVKRDLALPLYSNMCELV